MFSSFGWGEFVLVMVIGLIIIGPERLPSVIEDVRAAIYAARKGIANAKRELNGELEGLGDFREPIDTVTKYAAMGPRRAVSSLLFEGDEEYLESFDPRKVMEDEPAAPPQAPAPGTAGGSTAQGSTQETTPGGSTELPRKQAGFNWEDVV